MEENRIEACRIVFGSEPKDYEVYRFLSDNWKRFRFSPPVSGDELEDRRINPKRMQREIARQLQNPELVPKPSRR